MSPLTPRQVEILTFMVRYFEQNGRVPTIRDILLELDFRSTNGAADHLRRLETKGFLRRSGDGKWHGWRIVRLPDGTPVVPRLIRVADAEAAR